MATPTYSIFFHFNRFISSLYWLIQSLRQIYMDVLFVSVAFVFAFCLIIVSAMNNIHEKHYHELNKGLWEDVMVSWPDDSGIDEKLLIKEIQDILHTVNYELSWYKRMKMTCNIEKIEFYNQDIAKIHGDMDTWLKTYPENTNSHMQIHTGSVILSKFLSDQLTGSTIHVDPRTTRLYLNMADNLITEFNLQTSGELRGIHNLMIVNYKDYLNYFHDAAKPENVIGISLKKNDAAKIVNELKIGLANSVFRINDRNQMIEKMMYTQPRQAIELLTFTPRCLLILFGCVFLLNYIYLAGHNYQNKITQLQIFYYFNYGFFRRWMLFFALNFIPAVIGMVFASVIIGFDWPFNISGYFLKLNATILSDYSGWEIVFSSDVLLRLASMAILCMTVTLLMLWQKRDEVGL